MMGILEKLAGMFTSAGPETISWNQGGQTVLSSGGGGGGGTNWQSILSSGLGLASMGASLFASGEAADATLVNARQQSRALDLSAREEEIEAEREITRGKQEANNKMDELIRTISAQRASFAGNGIDVFFGTPNATAKNARDLASLQLSVSRDDATMKSLARRRQAAALREESLNTAVSAQATAKNQRLQGGITALATGADMLQRRVNRG